MINFVECLKSIIKITLFSDYLLNLEQPIVIKVPVRDLYIKDAETFDYVGLKTNMKSLAHGSCSIVDFDNYHTFP